MFAAANKHTFPWLAGSLRQFRSADGLDVGAVTNTPCPASCFARSGFVCRAPLRQTTNCRVVGAELQLVKASKSIIVSKYKLYPDYKKGSIVVGAQQILADIKRRPTSPPQADLPCLALVRHRGNLDLEEVASSRFQEESITSDPEVSWQSETVVDENETSLTQDADTDSTADECADNGLVVKRAFPIYVSLDDPLGEDTSQSISSDCVNDNFVVSLREESISLSEDKDLTIFYEVIDTPFDGYTDYSVHSSFGFSVLCVSYDEEMSSSPCQFLLVAHEEAIITFSNNENIWIQTIWLLAIIDVVSEDFVPGTEQWEHGAEFDPVSLEPSSSDSESQITLVGRRNMQADILVKQSPKVQFGPVKPPVRTIFPHILRSHKITELFYGPQITFVYRPLAIEVKAFAALPHTGNTYSFADEGVAWKSVSDFGASIINQLANVPLPIMKIHKNNAEIARPQNATNNMVHQVICQFILVILFYASSLQLIHHSLNFVSPGSVVMFSLHPTSAQSNEHSSHRKEVPIHLCHACDTQDAIAESHNMLLEVDVSPSISDSTNVSADTVETRQSSLKLNAPVFVPKSAGKEPPFNPASSAFAPAGIEEPPSASVPVEIEEKRHDQTKGDPAVDDSPSEANIRASVIPSRPQSVLKPSAQPFIPKSAAKPLLLPNAIPFIPPKVEEKQPVNYRDTEASLPGGSLLRPDAKPFEPSRGFLSSLKSSAPSFIPQSMQGNQSIGGAGKDTVGSRLRPDAKPFEMSRSLSSSILPASTADKQSTSLNPAALPFSPNSNVKILEDCDPISPTSSVLRAEALPFCPAQESRQTTMDNCPPRDAHSGLVSVDGMAEEFKDVDDHVDTTTSTRLDPYAPAFKPREVTRSILQPDDVAPKSVYRLNHSAPAFVPTMSIPKREDPVQTTSAHLNPFAMAFMPREGSKSMSELDSAILTSSPPSNTSDFPFTGTPRRRSKSMSQLTVSRSSVYLNVAVACTPQEESKLIPQLEDVMPTLSTHLNPSAAEITPRKPSNSMPQSSESVPQNSSCGSLRPTAAPFKPAKATAQSNQKQKDIDIRRVSHSDNFNDFTASAPPSSRMSSTSPSAHHDSHSIPLETNSPPPYRPFFPSSTKERPYKTPSPNEYTPLFVPTPAQLRNSGQNRPHRAPRHRMPTGVPSIAARA